MAEFRSEWAAASLGKVRYAEAYELQKKLVKARQEGRLEHDLVLLLEHPPVFTFGLRGGRENLILAEPEIRRRGVDMVQIERGGDVTFHGPGQLVCYLIVDQRAYGPDIPGFVRNIEEVMIRASRDEGVEAGRDPQNPGIWVKKNKLGSIGIAVRHGITYHGFALNVDMDLTPFQWIHPCGLKNVAMTSLAELKKEDVSMTSVKENIERHLSEVFNVRLKTVDQKYLDQLL